MRELRGVLLKPLRCCALSVVVFLSLTMAAYAGDPTMPLAEVQPGMKCTARSVLRGVDVSTFDAEVLDIIGDGADAGGISSGEPLILARFSGAAVDQTGIGPGFSGSPVYCPGADGQGRIIGVIAYGVGDYGSKLALLTPIESVLGTAVDPPKVANQAKSSAKVRRLIKGAYPLATPLTITGVHPAFATRLQRAAKSLHQPLIVAPAQPRFAPADPPPFVPGSAITTALASGSIYAGAIGTVSYVDGNSIWAFGHPLDGFGPRSLFLQPAYVYGVISNPVNVGDFSTYKLASPYGNVLGTLTNDGFNAIAGKLGQAPQVTRVSATGQDETGKKQQVVLDVANETDVGQGLSSVAPAAGVAFADVVARVLNSLPVTLSGRLCFTLNVREFAKPVQICSSIADRQGFFTDFLALSAEEPVALIENYEPRNLHITSVDAQVQVQRGYRVATIESIRGPRRVRRGKTIALKVKVRPYRGQTEEKTIKFRIPRSASPGVRTLQVFASDAIGSVFIPSAEGPGQDVGVKMVLRQLAASGQREKKDVFSGSLTDLQAGLKALNVYDGLYLALVKPSQLDDEDEIRPNLLRLSPTTLKRRIKIYEAYRQEGSQFSGQTGYSLRIVR